MNDEALLVGAETPVSSRMTARGSCGDCAYFQRNLQNFKVGLCKRRAPQLTFVTVPVKGGVGLQDAAGWPGTQAHEWCGEFGPRLMT